MEYTKLKVDLKTPIADQLADLGITNYLDLDKVKDLYPEQSEICDIEDGTEMLGKSPDDCDKIFKEQGRRGLTIREGLAILRKNPDVLKDHYIDLSGSRCDSDYVPFLRLNAFRPKLHCSYSSNANSGYGSSSTSLKNDLKIKEEILPSILTINGIKYKKYV